MPRDGPFLKRYLFRVQKLLFSLLFLPLACFASEWIELQDGTRVDGRILSVTSQTVLMDVQTSAAIREEKSFPRAAVAKIRRASQDDIAFGEVAAITVPATADNPAVYDALLEQKVRPFMKNFAYSKHMPEARRLAATLEAERARVASGEVKVDGEWMAADASPAERTELGGRVQLSKMKKAADPAAAMMAFEVLEKDFSASSSYPESVQLARGKLGELRTSLLRARADLDRRTREQKQGLELASEDRRLQMERGIAQEKAAVEAQIDRARQSGAKWLPVLPDAKVLDDLSKLAEAEDARLSKINIEPMMAGIAAARQARKRLESGELEAAKTSLTEAQKLWPQYVLLASLAETLKKAESQPAQAAAGSSATAQP